MTQQTTDELNEVELIELPEDDDHICNQNGCEKRAEWWYEHTCGSVTYRCTGHRDELDLALAFFDLICKQCGNKSPDPLPWKAIS